jgi:hypothetical protein
MPRSRHRRLARRHARPHPQLIKEADPDVVEEVKWRKPSNPSGVPVWEHAGIICTGETYKGYVKFTFAKGAKLPDPAGLFNGSLNGNTMRAIDIREGREIDEEALKELVRAAVALNVADRAAPPGRQEQEGEEHRRTRVTPAPEGAAAGDAEEGALRRDIGFFGSAFLSFNGVVGAGIFALPGTLYDKFGAFSPFLFPLFGLLALIVALPFARAAGHHKVSGGPVVYAAVFGPAAAFQAGWLYYVARAAALAANTTVLVTYLATFWPVLGSGVARGAVILAVTGLIVLVNIAGVRRAVRMLDALTLLKAAPLLLVAVLGLVTAGAAIEAPRACRRSATSRRQRSSSSMPSSGSRTASSRRRDRRSAAHHPARPGRHHPRHRRALFPDPARLCGGDGAGRRQGRADGRLRNRAPRPRRAQSSLRSRRSARSSATSAAA